MRIVQCVAAASMLVACSAAQPILPPSDGRVAVGTWGGDSGGLIAGDTATHVHIGCTFGDVSGRIPLDASGRFSVAGSYMLRAYPVQQGPTVPAQFTGQVDGATLVLTVTANDTVTHTTVVRGPVTLRYGDDPRMGPCPICRNPYDMRVSLALR
jgi:hypothetical protein